MKSARQRIQERRMQRSAGGSLSAISDQDDFPAVLDDHDGNDGEASGGEDFPAVNDSDQSLEVGAADASLSYVHSFITLCMVASAAMAMGVSFAPGKRSLSIELLPDNAGLTDAVAARWIFRQLSLTLIRLTPSLWMQPEFLLLEVLLKVIRTILQPDDAALLQRQELLLHPSRIQ